MKRFAAFTIAAMIVAGESAYCQNNPSTIHVVRDCGRERWDVKILSDTDTSLIDFAHPKSATVEELVRMRSLEPTEYMSRQWCEHTVYLLNAYLYGYSQNKDRDMQLYLRDLKTTRTIIASLPDPDCPEVMATSRASIYRALREWVQANLGAPSENLAHPIQVRIAGVGMYDRLNNQSGMSENGFELHPVISLERADLLASSAPLATVPTIKTAATERPTVKRVHHRRKVQHYARWHIYKAHRRYRRHYHKAQYVRLRV